MWLAPLRVFAALGRRVVVYREAGLRRAIPRYGPIPEDYLAQFLREQKHGIFLVVPYGLAEAFENLILTPAESERCFYQAFEMCFAAHRCFGAGFRPRPLR